jgi:hypothetical protein
VCQWLTGYIEKDEGYPGIAKDLEDCRTKLAVVTADRDKLLSTFGTSIKDVAKGIREAQQLAAERTRREALEAALHEIADFSEQFIADDEDGDERMYKVNQIADTAVALVSGKTEEDKG